jgi:hypothetical protein
VEFRNTTTTICVETQVKTYDVNGEIVSFQIWDTGIEIFSYVQMNELTL